MKLRIYGNIKDTEKSQAIIGANIKLFLDKKELQEVKSIKNGFFEIITEIDDSRIEGGQQLKVTVEKEGYQKQEHRVLTTEGSFNLDVELEPVAPIPEKPFNRMPLIISGGVVLALLIGAMIAWLLLRPKDPKIINFSLDSNSIDIGESATLSWDTKHAILLKIEPGIGEVEPKGDVKVKPARTMEYTLTAINEKKKTVSKALTLEVVDKKDANELLDTSGTIQTKSGGLNIMGSVGIGTINPGENKLQVDGYTMLGGGIANSHFPWGGNGWAYVSGKGIIFREDAAGKYEERMRVDDNGNVGIGTTNPDARLVVNGDQKVTGLIGTNGYDPRKGIPGGWGGGVHTWDVYAEGSIACGTNGVVKILINRDGGALKPGGGSWGSFSDIRLKKNVKKLTGALDKLTELQGVNFEWINPEEHGDQSGAQAGLIGQEVEKVFPEWVSEVEPLGKDKDLAEKGEKVKLLQFPHSFNAYIIEAIKELKAENEALKARISALEEAK